MRVKAAFVGLFVVAVLAFGGFGNNPESVAILNGQPAVLADPALAQDWYDTQVVYNLYSPLVYPTTDGSIQPHLASDWESIGGDGKVWRFTLRQGVAFHDGNEVTAADVAFSMERFMAIGKGYSGSVGTVKRASVLSKYEVEFELDKPSAVFPYTLVNFWVLNKQLVMENIEPGQYGEEFGDYGTAWLETHDAGSGSYVMVSHEIKERLTAERFEEYFLGWEDFGPNSIPIDNLVFLMVADRSAAGTLMKSRMLDLETIWVGKEKIEGFEKAGGINIVSFPPLNTTVWLNTTAIPTDDVHFRQAIIHAFDYEAVRALYPSSPSGPVLSSLQGSNPELALSEQNLEKAREELALSKYDPEQVTVSLQWLSGHELETPVMMQLQADLAEIGVKTELSQVPWMTLAGNLTNPESTANGSCIIATITYPSPDTYLYYSYHPKNAGGMFAGHWMEDAELGRLIDASRAEVDPEKSAALYNQIQEKVVSLGLGVYAMEVSIPHAIQDYLVGPRAIYPTIGPNVNMHNFRIDLERKEQLCGQ